eukprot:152974-Pelagomonas_calceolata.AAC.2
MPPPSSFHMGTFCPKPEAFVRPSRAQDQPFNKHAVSCSLYQASTYQAIKWTQRKTRASSFHMGMKQDLVGVSVHSRKPLHS